MNIKRNHFAFYFLVSLFVLNAFISFNYSAVASEDPQNSKSPQSSPYANLGAWIIIAGDRSDHDKLNYIIYGCEQVHNTLTGLGVSADDIYYLAPEVDGYSQSLYNDDVTTLANIDYAIGTWAAGKVDETKGLGMYIFDHGGVDVMCIPGTDLSASHLDSELDDLETATGCNRNIIVYEACHSGSFIDNLSQENRIILTATDQDHGSSVNPSHNWATFSEGFWSSVAKCRTIGRAFEDARAFVVASGHATSQFPWIDDNHDSVPHETDASGYLPNGGDGDDALDIIIGNFVSCMPPFRLYIPKWQYINIWEFKYVLELELSEDVQISEAIIKFIPPNWDPSELINQQADVADEKGIHSLLEDYLPAVQQVMDDGNHGIVMDDGEHGTVTLDINRLDESFEIPMRDTGEYQICAYVRNDKGVISDVVRSRVTFLKAGEEAPADRIPPTVKILDPADGAGVSGKIPIKVEADDNIALDRVQIYVDGVQVHDEMMLTKPYPIVYYFLDTTAYSNGVHNITAVAYDHVGLKAETSHKVDIKNEEKDDTTDGEKSDDSDEINILDIPGYTSGTILIISVLGIASILSKVKNYQKK
ncbi:Ig-like domain-containing protein [Candidatus Lokiarchaeum ossiferum]|uniref:Ig-like domain-containing protein n=1 Tax=Candidatus Lokiarchaeum ossiferum TaxID=2951803 RepID=UPI00352E3B29